jgi:hypothetical protein
MTADRRRDSRVRQPPIERKEENMHKGWFRIVASLLLLGALGITAARADELQDIKKKGVLVVGSKAD